MQHLLDILLPSLESLGVWGYWAIALFVFLQGFAPTSPLSPASVLVVLAGGLTAQGAFHFWDMVWFVTLADALGAELTFRLGRRGRAWLEGRHWLFDPSRLGRVERLFARIGAPAILIGRFMPGGAFVPLLAGIAHLDYRRFVPWNLFGALAYALVALAVGRA
ncbi:MAG: hypothetical protein D6801_08150, partial [Alphaproteobacteria bacterium]